MNSNYFDLVEIKTGNPENPSIKFTNSDFIEILKIHIRENSNTYLINVYVDLQSISFRLFRFSILKDVNIDIEHIKTKLVEYMLYRYNLDSFKVFYTPSKLIQLFQTEWLKNIIFHNEKGPAILILGGHHIFQTFILHNKTVTDEVDKYLLLMNK